MALLPPDAALYEQAPCGLLLTRTDGTILRVNTTFCRWVGLQAADLVDRRRVQDLLTMGGRIFHLTHWAPLLQMQGSLAEVKLDLVKADGRPLPVLMNVVRRREEAGEFDAVSVTVAEDRHAYERELLAARRRAEDLLVQQQRAQAALAQAEAQLREALAQSRDRALFAEQLIGIVGHDLRTPLQVIRTNAQLLERRRPAGTPPDRVAEVIARSTRRAQRLVDDLLDFTAARLGRGLSTAMVRFNLEQTVSESIEELRIAHSAHRIEHLHAGDCEAVGDPHRITQLLGNLVSNAAAYGDAGRAIEVSSGGDGRGEWSLCVRNWGPTIEPSLCASLFEPMVRGAIAGEQRSVGLGLYIVREIARAHGGDVFVSSVAGETTFRFVWTSEAAAATLRPDAGP